MTKGKKTEKIKREKVSKWKRPTKELPQKEIEQDLKEITKEDKKEVFDLNFSINRNQLIARIPSRLKQLLNLSEKSILRIEIDETSNRIKSKCRLIKDGTR